MKVIPVVHVQCVSADKPERSPGLSSRRRIPGVGGHFKPFVNAVDAYRMSFPEAVFHTERSCENACISKHERNRFATQRPYAVEIFLLKRKYWLCFARLHLKQQQQSDRSYFFGPKHI